MFIADSLNAETEERKRKKLPQYFDEYPNECGDGWHPVLLHMLNLRCQRGKLEVHELGSWKPKDCMAVQYTRLDASAVPIVCRSPGGFLQSWFSFRVGRLKNLSSATCMGWLQGRDRDCGSSSW